MLQANPQGHISHATGCGKVGSGEVRVLSIPPRGENCWPFLVREGADTLSLPPLEPEDLDGIPCDLWALCFGGRTHPELDQEEGMRGPTIIQLPQAALFLREFVIDLPDVHTLKGGRSRAGAVLADVYEQVPLVLRRVGRG